MRVNGNVHTQVMANPCPILHKHCQVLSTHREDLGTTGRVTQTVSRCNCTLLRKHIFHVLGTSVFTEQCPDVNVQCQDVGACHKQW